MNKRLARAAVVGVAVAICVPTVAFASPSQFNLSASNQNGVPKQINPSSPTASGITGQVGTRIVQAFGYDNTVNPSTCGAAGNAGGTIIYTVQVGNTAADLTNGNLIVTKVNNNNVSENFGSMTLKGFGHGVAIGVEPFASSECPVNARLWIETAAKPNASGEARGSAIVRFAFVAGRVLTYNSASNTITKSGDTSTAAWQAYPRHLVPGSTENSVALDPTRHRLALRYRATPTGPYLYAVYDSSAIAAFPPENASGTNNNYSSALVAPPAALPAGTPGTFQGFTIYNGWIYSVTEVNHHNPSLPQPQPPNYPVVTGQRVGNPSLYERGTFATQTLAGNNFTNNEPEGIAVRFTTSAGVETPYLRFGVGYGATGSRQLATYQLIP